MMRIQRAIGQGWAGLTFCGLLAAAAFFGGYWKGQHSQTDKDSVSTQGNPAVVQPPLLGHPLPSVFDPKLPPGVTPEMVELRQDQEKLLQMRGTNGAPTDAQTQQEKAALLQRQQQFDEAIAKQRARNPLAEPAPLQIPPNASPQQKAYLTERDKLIRDEIALLNQHKNDDPSTRQAAMQQWRLQNVARFQQLRQMAQALAQNSPQASSTNPSPVHP